MNRVDQTATAETELQRAIDCGELIRLYQPIIELPTGALRYVEALLRWDHPGRGLLAPAEFLVQEDDDKLLVRIGWSVVIEAARRAGEWRRAYPDHPITVSVNLSAGHLSSRDLSSRVEHLLHDNEVPGDHALAFEISERHLTRRLRARDRLVPLRNLGVEVIVDDFGASAATGDLGATELRDATLEVFESLRDFPLDAVKLDPRFTSRLGEFTPEVVSAAHAADLRVVVSSVEDEAAAQAAIEAGFDLAQGFFFHRPERPAYVDGLLASR